MKKRQVVVRRSEVSTRRRSYNNSSAVRTVRYIECQKNYAASVGGYAVDGCREFMASGEDGTREAFVCAACGCHRNFHRKEEEVVDASCECSSP